MSSSSGLLKLAAKHLSERKGRAVLTGLGVALGVALFTGAVMTTMSVTNGLNQWARDARGLSDVVISPAGRNGMGAFASYGTGYISDEEAAELAQLGGVVDSLGMVVFSSSITTSDGRSTTIRINRSAPAFVVGIDLDAAPRMYTVETAEGALPRGGEPSVALSRPLAREYDVELGEVLRVSTPTGERELTVAGLLADRGVARLGPLMVTSLETARQLNGAGAVFTQLALRLEDGVDAAAWEAENAGRLHGLEVESGADLDFALRGLSLLAGSLTVLAAGVVVVAGFLVYLSLATAVVERTRLYGLLHSLGATARQVRNAVVGEALILGIVSSTVGIAFGVGIAALLFAVTSRFVGDGVPFQIAPSALVAGALLGVGTTLVSSLVPARRAARLDPVVAMAGAYTVDNRLGQAWVIGAVGIVVGGAGLLTSPPMQTMLVFVPMLLFGAIVVLPALLRPVARALGAATAHLARGTGRIAVLHIARERTRSAYTVALVMAVVALAIAAGAARASFTESMTEQIDAAYGFDFEVLSASTFGPEFVDAVAHVDGVGEVATQVQASAELIVDGRQELTQVRVIDPAYLDVVGMQWVDGGRQAGLAALSSAGSVIFPQSTAERIGLDRGDEVTLTTARGRRPLRIAATAVISNAVPTIFVGQEAGRTLFGASQPNRVFVNVASGADPEQVRSNLETELDGMATFIVGTVDDLKADIRSQIGAGLNGLLILLAMAGTVGLFGLANTLVVSAMQRHRETAVLRALGARRRQVAAASVAEAVTLVGCAFLIGLPVGAFLSRPFVEAARQGVGDLTVDFVFPWRFLPVLAGLALIVGVIAAAWPARRSARIEVDVALRMD